jgi:hypothetical protein
LPRSPFILEARVTYLHLIPPLAKQTFRDVIIKLLVFTFAMVTIPIGSYFLAVNTFFKGALLIHNPLHSPTHCVNADNSTLAGATAAVMANLVLISYVIVAYQEDQSDRVAEEERLRKAQ